jgi:hypothetical protein
LFSESDKPLKHPTPSKIKLKRWRALWADALARLEQEGEVSLAQARLLERLVLNLEAADKALALAVKTPIVTGSTGQETAHPGFAVAARADSLALSIAQRLILNPRQRPGADDDETEDADPIAQARDELAARRRMARSA